MNFEQDGATVVSTGTMKSGKGASTGADLRFHTSVEYTNLTHPKRRELKAWRINPEVRAAAKALKSQRSGHNNNPSPRKQTGEQTKFITYAVETSLTKEVKSEQIVSKDSTQAKDFAVYVFNKIAGKKSATLRTATANSVDSQRFPKSILKKANNA